MFCFVFYVRVYVFFISFVSLSVFLVYLLLFIVRFLFVCIFAIFYFVCFVLLDFYSLYGSLPQQRLRLGIPVIAPDRWSSGCRRSARMSAGSGRRFFAFYSVASSGLPARARRASPGLPSCGAPGFPGSRAPG